MFGLPWVSQIVRFSGCPLIPPESLIWATAAFIPPATSGYGLFVPLSAADPMMFMGVPVSLLPLLVVVLLLVPDCELQPENTMHVTAMAATGAMDLSFMDVLRWESTVTVTRITS